MMDITENELLLQVPTSLGLNYKVAINELISDVNKRRLSGLSYPNQWRADQRLFRGQTILMLRGMYACGINPMNDWNRIYEASGPQGIVAFRYANMIPMFHSEQSDIQLAVRDVALILASHFEASGSDLADILYPTLTRQIGRFNN